MKKIYPFALILLTILTLLSLALNVATIGALFWARETALQTIRGSRQFAAQVRQSTFSHTIQVDREIPVETSVPFQEEVLVPIDTTIPINTTVTVPIEAGILGTLEIDIPIRTFVPVNLEVAVPISQTIDVSTTVHLDLDVPIEIPVAETPLDGQLDGLDQALQQIEQKLKDPFSNREIDVGVQE